MALCVARTRHHPESVAGLSPFPPRHQRERVTVSLARETDERERSQNDAPSSSGAYMRNIAAMNDIDWQ